MNCYKCGHPEPVIEVIDVDTGEVAEYCSPCLPVDLSPEVV